MQGCKWRAKKAGWESRSVRGSGGPGGLRTEYQPPADVLAQIHAFLEVNPDFFGKDKRRTRPELAAVSKQVFGDAPARLAQNPNAKFEEMLKRVAEASQATVRISQQYNDALPVGWTSLIQELMAIHGLSEAGAAKVIQALVLAREGA